MTICKYYDRATTGRGHNSKIANLAIKLPHKRHLKTISSLKPWGATNNRERPVVAQLRYFNVLNQFHKIFKKCLVPLYGDLKAYLVLVVCLRISTIDSTTLLGVNQHLVIHCRYLRPYHR